MIPPLFLPSLKLEDCEDKNDNNDGDIYDNDEVPDHN